MPLYRITTPEQVVFHYPVAGLITRGMAWLVDQLIIWVLFVVGVLVFMWLGAVGFVAILLLKFGLDFAYFAWFEAQRQGQTPGKRRLRIRVMGAQGGRVSVVDAMLRTFLRAIDSLGMIPLGAVVGAGVAFIDPYHRRLGDLAADTLVIRNKTLTAPRPLLRQRQRFNSIAEDAGARARVIARATRAERDLLNDLMHRRDGLHPEAREALFTRAAGYFRKRYELPTHLEQLSDEQVVLGLALLLVSERPLT